MNRLREKAKLVWKFLFAIIESGDTVEILNNKDGLEGAEGKVIAITTTPKGMEIRYYIEVSYKYNRNVFILCRREEIRLVS